MNDWKNGSSPQGAANSSATPTTSPQPQRPVILIPPAGARPQARLWVGPTRAAVVEVVKRRVSAAESASPSAAPRTATEVAAKPPRPQGETANSQEASQATSAIGRGPIARAANAERRALLGCTVPIARAAQARPESPGPRSCDLDRLLNESEVAAMLSLAPATLRNWRVKGLGPMFTRLSRRCVRYRRADVDGWLSGRVARSTSDNDDGGR